MAAADERFHGGAVPGAEAMARAALAAAPVPTAVITLDAPDPARVLLVSESLATLLGQRAEELIGQRLTDLVQLNTAGNDPLSPQAFTEEPTTVCTALRRPEGVPLVLELKAARVPGGSALAVVQLYDVTRREQAERSIREDLRYLQDIADHASVDIYVKDLQGRYVFTNAQFERRCGLRREQVRGRTDLDIRPRDIALAYREHDAQVLATGRAIEIEEPALDARTWLSDKFPLTDDSGRPSALGGISTDITERKRAEAAAQEARAEAEQAKTALALQRSQLLQAIPEQNAVEVAHRYRPADGQAGVGGDWYDVIELPGARVALVVGDVVGHGLHAAATMGQFRTAVDNFSALDLPPDEILAHLNELVARIDDREGGVGVTGATCLYAVYDPVSGSATVARAGHPGPALVHPDGTVTFPSVPVSPPLGMAAGMPFESAELSLPEGSQLVLYTNGLIEDRGRDVDLGLGLLQESLAGHPHRGPEATCQAVFDTLAPTRPSDDVALLVARTRRLSPGQTASWQVPSAPEAVAPIRAACTRQLHAWGLQDIAFTTELILSELITNAIRYGTQPIRVRLLHDRALICEVSDGSSTSPHLRRAAATDEGGRGLFLVARLARRWGTRYTPHDKVVWSEQALHDGDARMTWLDPPPA